MKCTENFDNDIACKIIHRFKTNQSGSTNLKLIEFLQLDNFCVNIKTFNTVPTSNTSPSETSIHLTFLDQIPLIKVLYKQCTPSSDAAKRGV